MESPNRKKKAKSGKAIKSFLTSTQEHMENLIDTFSNVESEYKYEEIEDIFNTITLRAADKIEPGIPLESEKGVTDKFSMTLPQLKIIEKQLSAFDKPTIEKILVENFWSKVDLVRTQKSALYLHKCLFRGASTLGGNPHHKLSVQLDLVISSNKVNGFLKKLHFPKAEDNTFLQQFIMSGLKGKFPEKILEANKFLERNVLGLYTKHPSILLDDTFKNSIDTFKKLKKNGLLNEALNLMESRSSHYLEPIFQMNCFPELAETLNNSDSEHLMRLEYSLYEKKSVCPIEINMNDIRMYCDELSGFIFFFILFYKIYTKENLWKWLCHYNIYIFSECTEETSLQAKLIDFRKKSRTSLTRIDPAMFLTKDITGKHLLTTKILMVLFKK